MCPTYLCIPYVQNMKVQSTARMVLEGSNQQKCAILCFPNLGKLYILTLSF